MENVTWKWWGFSTVTLKLRHPETTAWHIGAKSTIQPLYVPYDAVLNSKQSSAEYCVLNKMSSHLKVPACNFSGLPQLSTLLRLCLKPTMFVSEPLKSSTVAKRNERSRSTRRQRKRFKNAFESNLKKCYINGNCWENDFLNVTIRGSLARSPRGSK